MKQLTAALMLVLLLSFSSAPAWTEDKTGWTTDEADWTTDKAGLSGAGWSVARDGARDGQFTLGLLAPLGESGKTIKTGTPEEAGQSRKNSEPKAGLAADISKFALRRIAEIQGLPYRFIQSPREMADYPLIIMASAPSNAQLDTVWREALYNYVENGGVLFVPGRAGSELHPLLGI
ncbi:MAG: hypothetical protein R6V86_02930, partial [Spirochaetia bacterium]